MCGIQIPAINSNFSIHLYIRSISYLRKSIHSYFQSKHHLAWTTQQIQWLISIFGVPNLFTLSLKTGEATLWSRVSLLVKKLAICKGKYSATLWLRFGRNTALLRADVRKTFLRWFSILFIASSRRSSSAFSKSFTSMIFTLWNKQALSLIKLSTNFMNYAILTTI